MDCLFCKIAAGTIPVTRLYENDHVLAFPDISPQAPVHVLVIPKKHLASHAHGTAEDAAVYGELLAAAGEVAKAQGLDNGYRMVINTGADGGQTVGHLHVHLLGGRPMHWPPG
ncbi:histidine triad (HIT) family protein [Bryocella elongata]|uniref:Histidine triad (HIT) family protein n=1 Tax=Bryocella elongata TaxID=863522 RepID=A0A1H6BLX9_9BACT|nr:histidine triad nucleotide-binding protein [Bryocella elongata]SEG61377.1 histidine triad (HIT) family protein [Bryocella elongata]